MILPRAFTHLNPALDAAFGYKRLPCLLDNPVHRFHFLVHSVLWHCRFDVRKGILPLKVEWWGVGVLSWAAVLSEMDIVCIWSSWCHCRPKTPSSLASFKSRLVLPFWYRLAKVVLDIRPLNRFSSSLSFFSLDTYQFLLSMNCFMVVLVTFFNLLLVLPLLP